MFDEYYSVSLSFWTRSGLREKARQGHLLGTLPWGYTRDKDLYVIGDLTKAQYTMRRQTIQADLELLDPTLDAAIAQAEQVLSNFSEFWELETSPQERHRFLLSLFEQVFVDGKEIVAVKPRGRLESYFQAATELSVNPVKVRRD